MLLEPDWDKRDRDNTTPYIYIYHAKMRILIGKEMNEERKKKKTMPIGIFYELWEMQNSNNPVATLLHVNVFFYD